MKAQPQKSTARGQKFKPLGLSIAILAAGIIYGLFPMLPLVLVAWSQISRGHVVSDIVGGPAGDISIILGFLTLVACVPAWRGRPARIRWILILVVWIQSIFQIYRFYGASKPASCGFNEACTNFSLGPAAYCAVVFVILVSLYITWYMNRAPAREFYRN